jgi:hypothetical protein
MNDSSLTLQARQCKLSQMSIKKQNKHECSAPPLSRNNTVARHVPLMTMCVIQLKMDIHTSETFALVKMLLKIEYLY